MKLHKIDLLCCFIFNNDELMTSEYELTYNNSYNTLFMTV